ncbi:hypothetical protein CQA57_05785 [Helicobacter anseris]|uniref:Uncharacterized protein n=1 Tax=Helicobacter anseris TaxID=375926 RepID=A0A3D8J7E3_9HELI|nr:hypothetical protein [Helicobacter anseris]RDU73036.1 hypothetical protein CQA57_05785 [Helicobacter anseris]
MPKNKGDIRSHPAYRILSNIKAFCYNKNMKHYKNIGAKGIGVCDEWKNSYAAFCKWADENGFKKGECTLARKDLTKDYSPENCFFKKRENKTERKIVKLANEKMSARLDIGIGHFNSREEASEARIKYLFIFETIVKNLDVLMKTDKVFGDEEKENIIQAIEKTLAKQKVIIAREINKKSVEYFFVYSNEILDFESFLIKKFDTEKKVKKLFEKNDFLTNAIVEKPICATNKEMRRVIDRHIAKDIFTFTIDKKWEKSEKKIHLRGGGLKQ